LAQQKGASIIYEDGDESISQCLDASQALRPAATGVDARL